jgi:hypothetical protein
MSKPDQRSGCVAAAFELAEVVGHGGRAAGDSITSVTATARDGLVVRCSVGLGISGSAPTEDLPAGVLCRLMVFGAGGRRSMPPLRGGN